MASAEQNAAVYWVTELDLTGLKELESGDLWDWTTSRSRKLEVRNLVDEFRAGYEAVVQPHVRYRNFFWATYVEWARGDLPDVVQWSPLTELDGKLAMVANVRLTDDRVVVNKPEWALHGCASRSPAACPSSCAPAWSAGTGKPHGWTATTSGTRGRCTSG